MGVSGVWVGGCGCEGVRVWVIMVVFYLCLHPHSQPDSFEILIKISIYMLWSKLEFGQI